MIISHVTMSRCNFIFLVHVFEIRKHLEIYLEIYSCYYTYISILYICIRYSLSASNCLSFVLVLDSRGKVQTKDPRVDILPAICQKHSSTANLFCCDEYTYTMRYASRFVQTNARRWIAYGLEKIA